MADRSVKEDLPAEVFEGAHHRERLRERYLRNGLDGFHPYEVLELILAYAIPRRDTKPLAKELIRRFGSLTEVLNAPVEVLCEVKGMGERTALLLKLLRDTAAYHLRENLPGKSAIRNSRDIYEYLCAYYKGLKHEEFKVIYLDAQNTVLFEETLFTGTNNESKVYIRKVVERVMQTHAASVVIVHNHPSGRLEPSREDIGVTLKLRSALELIEVHLLDHVIVGDNDYLSFVAEKIL
jgi:DNA repair protein RadC